MRARSILVAAAFLAVFAAPLAVLGFMAVAPGWRFPDVVPAAYGTRALQVLAAQWRDVAASLGSSVLYSLTATLLAFGLCLAPAKALARQEFRGKALAEGLFLAPALVPSMTFAMGLSAVFVRIGLADTFAGVVLVLTLFAYPYMLRALIAGYQALGPEYERCAANLGASPACIFFRVELPLILPAALAGGTVVFLVAYSEYFLVFLVGGGVVPSFSGYLFPVLASSDRALGALLTLVFAAVPLALFLALEATVGRLYRRMGYRLG